MYLDGWREHLRRPFRNKSPPCVCIYVYTCVCVCMCVCVCVSDLSLSLFLSFFLSPSLQTVDLSSHTLIQTSSSGRHASVYDHHERSRGEIEESGHPSGASMLWKRISSARLTTRRRGRLWHTQEHILRLHTKNLLVHSARGAHVL
jgi:hypothetical protein